ncbi:MAG: hypothetical protein RIB63_23045, partial [Fulvivirga sp.]
MLISTYGFSQDADPLQETYEKANAKLEEGDYRNAILDYSQLINSKFTNDEVFVKRGIAHFKMKDYAKAQEDLDKAVKARQNSAELFGYLGMTKYELKDYQGAASDLKKGASMG